MTVKGRLKRKDPNKTNFRNKDTKIVTTYTIHI